MDMPNNMFCSLDMLAEVASRALLNDSSLTVNRPLPPTESNDQGLISNMPLQRSKTNIKVSSASPRKSLHSADKLTLDQIKCLSEKNLIYMFSELICDEIKRNYSFQCYLIPNKCSQVFNSFGNETRARCNMKVHLLNHIKDLATAANNASKNAENFMAEPLHIRRKRLKEVTKKNVRKKKQAKPIYPMYQRNNTYGYAMNDSGELYKSGGQTKTVRHATLNTVSEIDFDKWSSAYKRCFGERTKDFASDDFKNVVYSDEPECMVNDQMVRTGGSCKLQSSKLGTESRRKVSDVFEYNSDYEDPHLDWNVSSESKVSLSIIHDHSYCSVHGKVFDCNPSSSGESSKNSYEISSFEPNEMFHQCLQREFPLIIPTPPFPFIYVPVLPHIARIQEISYNFRTSGC